MPDPSPETSRSTTALFVRAVIPMLLAASSVALVAVALRGAPASASGGAEAPVSQAEGP